MPLSEWLYAPKGPSADGPPHRALQRSKPASAGSRAVTPPLPWAPSVSGPNPQGPAAD